MSKKILIIGIQLATGSVQREVFSSKVSLLDWDIILFRPSIDSYYSSEQYQGKPCLNDERSFALKEAAEHWRREIKQAIETGKTVIVFLPPVSEVYIANGDREYSGTGRNQRVTRIVVPIKNYYSLPFDLKPVNAAGTGIKLTPDGCSVLAEYWKEFGDLSKYQVTLDAGFKNITLVTKSGDRTVGAIVKNASSGGAIVLLPDLDFDQKGFTQRSGDELAWTKKARGFASEFIAAIMHLDATLRKAADVTPEPSWAKDEAYEMPVEAGLRAELLEAEQAVVFAQKKKEDIQDSLSKAANPRSLLYEKGPRLEEAIIDALRILGFTCSRYKQGGSEFDVVFECPEGRLIGEAEGKDSKPINVEKLRQLSMNINEDLQREEVNETAKGVLFGNGYRLEQPEKRGTQFTEKCISAARQFNTALIATQELFKAVQYLSKRADAEYGARCRASILAGTGIVTLPTPEHSDSIEVVSAQVEPAAKVT